MLFRVSAGVEGGARAEASFSVSVPPYLVTMNQEAGKVVRILAEKRVVDYDRHLPQFLVSSTGPHEFKIPHNPHSDDLIGLLQHIEAFGSFWCGIERIQWQEAKYEWIPESPEEKAKLSVHSYSSSEKYPEFPVLIHPNIVRDLMLNRQRLQHLVVPMSFFREGMNDFADCKYISSFCNFYYFLEDLYGQGKTKNVAVLEAFKGSKQLSASSHQIADILKRREFGPRRDNVLTMLKAENCEITGPGLLEFLVKMRGNLHHFSQRSTKTKGHPLNQARFDGVAYLAMAICMGIVPQTVVNGEVQ